MGLKTLPPLKSKMHVYSDEIEMDSTSQYAIHVEKVNDNPTTKHGIKKVPISNNERKKKLMALLIKDLKLLKLNTKGSFKVLSKRLEMYNNKKCIPNMCGKVVFDYYVVIDYEATCDNRQKSFDSNNQEIIEFPAVLLNCHTGEVEDEFQFYCRPVINPLLTDYCIQLTGITQKKVNKAHLFHEVLDSFNKWLQNKKLGSKYSFAIVTDGSKDIGHFLKRQCVLSQIDFPEYCKYWINIRKTFSKFYRTRDLTHLARVTDDTVLNTMMKEIGYEFQGKSHSGMDDSRNIAFIAQRLLQDGASLIFNEKLLEENVDKKKDVFSAPVTKEEFEEIYKTFKPNFLANKSSNSSKTLDTKTKDVLEKACTKKSTDGKQSVEGVAKIPVVESDSANNGTPIKTKAKKNLPPTKGAAKIPTKDNPTKNSSKVTAVGKNLVQKEITNVSTKDSLEKISSKKIKAPKSGKTANISPAQSSGKNSTKAKVQSEIKEVSTKDSQVKISSEEIKKPTSGKTAKVSTAKSSVKSTPVKSSSKIPATSAQSSKSADDLKQLLLRAKRDFYCKCEFMPFKEVAPFKKHIEDLKKLLEAARAREDQSGAQKETKAAVLLVTKLDKQKKLKVTQASKSVSNNCQSVKKNDSEKVENQLKSEASHQPSSVAKPTKQQLPMISNSGLFQSLDGNHAIENSSSMTAEEERLFFEDFENLLTMKTSVAIPNKNS